jgi:pyruvate formate lyase activating enzyme
MRIVGFNKTSLLDWDGHVVAVIYLPGCNFRCPHCHNRDIVLESEALDEVPFEVVEEYVRENCGFLDGVVVTGGEPTIHRDLPALLARLKALNMKVKLDTNGSEPDMLQDLIDAGLVDYVALDIKAPLEAKYDDVAGARVPLDKIKRSIEVLRTSGIDHEFRTTVVPILLTPDDVERIAAYIGGARVYALQQFRPENTLDPHLSMVRPYPGPEVLAMAERARQYVRKVVVRGDV